MWEFGRSYKCTSSAGFQVKSIFLFLLEEIHCRISSLLNIYFVCSFSFDQFYLGRHLLWEFCVVKNLHFSCKLYFCEVIYCKSLAL